MDDKILRKLNLNNSSLRARQNNYFKIIETIHYGVHSDIILILSYIKIDYYFSRTDAVGLLSKVEFIA